jgi:hypothetical protein
MHKPAEIDGDQLLHSVNVMVKSVMLRLLLMRMMVMVMVMLVHVNQQKVIWID